jgi:23S rRNA pseudouridine2457 synthase
MLVSHFDSVNCQKPKENDTKLSYHPSMSKIILLNKPFHVLSQFTDDQGRSTLSEYISQSAVYPAGRLDYDSEGLLLLTDDGGIQHQISHPKKKMAKTYWVQVEGAPSKEQLKPLTDGIELNDGPCKPAKVKCIPTPNIWERNPPIRQRQNDQTSWLEIIISEGRNRQVRRMTAAIGFPTLRLIRVQIGSWKLEDLKPGESKTLTIHSTHKPSPDKKTGKRSSNKRIPHRSRKL